MRRTQVFEWLRLLLFGVAVFVLISNTLQNARVSGPSMEPTLHTGEQLMVAKMPYLQVAGTPFEGLPSTAIGVLRYPFGGPRRGDVLVLRDPTEPAVQLVKRLIGLPGETILVVQEHVYINGTLLNEPFVHVMANYTYPADGVPARIPEDSYFVLGDNRPMSDDSSQGWFAPANDLVGRALLRYWPLDRFSPAAHAALHLEDQ